MLSADRNHMFIELFFASFLAFAISAVCGGGAGLLLIPILGFSLPVIQVPTALTIGTAMSSFSRVWVFFDVIRWDIFRRFFPTALLGLALGTWLLSYLDPIYLELCMSLFLVSNLAQLIIRSTETSFKNPASSQILPLIGFLAGMISGLTGATGVLFNRFYLSYRMSNEEIIATRAANEGLLHLIKIYIYAHLGFLTMTVMKTGLVVAVAAVLSTLFMKSVLPRISKRLFASIGYAAMGIAGVLMFNSAIAQINLMHEPDLKVRHLAKGFDASWSWDKLIYSLEFKYQEGFEFESVVPFSSLTPAEQAFVYSQQALYAKVIIEKVATLTTQTYEAYFYDEQDRLTNKIKFKPIQ